MWYFKDRKSVKLPALVRLQSFTLDDVKWLPRSRLEFCLVDGVSWTTLHGLALCAFYCRKADTDSGLSTAFSTVANDGNNTNGTNTRQIYIYFKYILK